MPSVLKLLTMILTFGASYVLACEHYEIYNNMFSSTTPRPIPYRKGSNYGDEVIHISQNN